MSATLTSSVISAIPTLAGSRAQAEVQQRRDIFERTQAAETAVLTPADPGGLSHDLRHALAARIAALHGMPDQADRYAKGAINLALAALAVVGTTSADPTTAAILAFTDAVSSNPRDITAQDVKTLQSVGISDADIVRLAELNAFLAYQLRLIAGLRLMVSPQNAQ